MPANPPLGIYRPRGYPPQDPQIPLEPWQIANPGDRGSAPGANPDPSQFSSPWGDDTAAGIARMQNPDYAARGATGQLLSSAAFAPAPNEASGGAQAQFLANGQMPANMPTVPGPSGSQPPLGQSSLGQPPIGQPGQTMGQPAAAGSNQPGADYAASVQPQMGTFGRRRPGYGTLLGRGNFQSPGRM